MRKIFSKKVVTTTIKSSNIKFVDGMPQAVENTDIVELGRFTDEQAQKLVIEKFGVGNMVVSNEQEEKTYRFNVLDILPYALVDEDKQEGDEEETED